MEGAGVLPITTARHCTVLAHGLSFQHAGRVEARCHLDHCINVVGGKLPADDVIGCADLRLQLLRGLAKEELRLQLHHVGHIAARQECLH